MSEETFNLFSTTPDTVSTIEPTRSISLYQGRIFQMVYRDRAKLRIRREVYGRLVDLQPILEKGKLYGIRLLFRLGTWDGVKWREDKELKDYNYGPFDTMSVLEEEISMPVEDVDDNGNRIMRPVKFVVQVVALSQVAEHEKGKTIEMKFTLFPRM